MDNHYVIKTMKETEQNSLFLELKNKHGFASEILIHSFQKYYIGNDGKYNPIFWQLGVDLELYNGTVNGKSVWHENERAPAIFGGHLLRYYSNQTICIVHDPKDALIFDMYFSDIIWLSAATVNSFDKQIPKSAKVRIFGDGNPQWATTLNNYLKSIGVNSHILKTKVSVENCLAAGPPDFKYEIPDFKMFESANYKFRKRLELLFEEAAQNEHVKKLSLALDLKIENIELIEKPKPKESRCLIVTVLPCNTPFPQKEAPDGCCECGMLDYLCYKTEEEANQSFMAAYPERFKDGIFIPQIMP